MLAKHFLRQMKKKVLKTYQHQILQNCYLKNENKTYKKKEGNGYNISKKESSFKDIKKNSPPYYSKLKKEKKERERGSSGPIKKKKRNISTFFKANNEFHSKKIIFCKS